MIGAGPVGGLDGGLKVEHVQRLAENDRDPGRLGSRSGIRPCSASVLPFQCVSLGLEVGGLLAQQSAYVVV
jgi:hypothetical protein